MVRKSVAHFSMLQDWADRLGRRGCVNVFRMALSVIGENELIYLSPALNNQSLRPSKGKLHPKT